MAARWPIEDGRRIFLPHEAYWTKLATTATAACVRCGAHRIGVMSVHLPSPGCALRDERQAQVDAILAAAAAIDGPLIVGGDFNAAWIGSRFEDAGFTWTNKDLPGTRALLWMALKLDHLFVRGLRLAADGPPAGVVDAGDASDHDLVWARLEFPGAGRASRP